MDSYIPYLHVFFFLSLFLYFYKNNRNGKYKLVLVIIGVYLFSSIAGVVHYFGRNSNYKNLSLLPSLFYFLLFYIAIIPLKKSDVSKIPQFEINIKFVRYLCIFLLLISILPFLESVLKIRTFFALSNVGNYVSDLHNDRQTGEANKVVALSSFSNQLLRFAIWFTELLPILLFYMIVKFKKINIYTIGLIIAQILVLLNSMLGGGRSVFVQIIIYYVFIYFIFSNQFSSSIKRKIHRVFFVIGGFSIVFLLLITIWRFQNSGKNSGVVDQNKAIVEWMALYAGEGMLNFNEYVWNTKAYTEGDRTVPYFKRLLGLHTFEENFDRRLYWESRTGTPENIFYTTIGNFIQDFGPFLGSLFIFSISFITSKVTQRKELKKIHNVYIIALYYKILALGIFFFPYGGFTGGKSLIRISIIILLIIFIERNFKKRHVIRKANIPNPPSLIKTTA